LLCLKRLINTAILISITFTVLLVMETNLDILLQLKKGNELAFRQVFELYFRKVYHFIYKYVKNKEEAEDITQNVFIRIWNKRESIDTSKGFDGFLFTIAYRLVIDQLRQHALRPGGKLNVDAQDAAFISTLTAEDTLNEHTLASTYQKALDTLPPKRKEIFILSRHEGLSNKAIAEKLDISIKTVENQMTAALASLKGHFRKEEMGFFFLAMITIS
jgi:RNA polymerase sigma-70 factor, ECF subfamily